MIKSLTNITARSPLQKIPNVGPSIAHDMNRLGIQRIEDLINQDPEAMYLALCGLDGVRHDPCVGDVFAAAVDFARGKPAAPWWEYSRRRKSAERTLKAKGEADV